MSDVTGKCRAHKHRHGGISFCWTLGHWNFESLFHSTTGAFMLCGSMGSQDLYITRQDAIEILRGDKKVDDIAEKYYTYWQRKTS